MQLVNTWRSQCTGEAASEPTILPMRPSVDRSGGLNSVTLPAALSDPHPVAMQLCQLLMHPVYPGFT